MPTIAVFAGIAIHMYFLEPGLNPPYIHCECRKFGAAIDIRALQILDGSLPAKENRLVAEWMHAIRKNCLISGMRGRFGNCRLFRERAFSRQAQTPTPENPPLASISGRTAQESRPA